MAIQRGLFGPISGKIGDRVYATVNGVTYVRSLPRKTTIPATEKQLIQRAKFGLVSSFLHPIGWILNSSYKVINRKKTGIWVSFRQIMDVAVRGEYPDFEIDYAKANLIQGHLAPPGETCITAEKQNLNLSWSFNQQVNSYPTDELIVLVYCISLKEFWCNDKTGLRRSDECGSIILPEEYAERECCIWLFYSSETQNEYSNSVYLGKVNTY